MTELTNFKLQFATRMQGDFSLCIATLIMILMIVSQSNGQGTAPPTIALTATSAGAPGAFPNTSDSGFEDTSVNAGPTSTFYYGTQPIGSNTWGAWTFNGRCGIAHSSSPLAQWNPNLPIQKHMAFLQEQSTITTNFSFAAGTWRVRFKGTQRHNGTNYENQHIRVTVGGMQVDQVDLNDGQYEEYVSRVFTFSTATTTSVTFSSLDPDGKGATGFIDDVLLEPIADWNNPSTWGPGTPGSTNPVHIPSGVAVALTSVSAAQDILVEGELLVTNLDLKISTDFVMVTGVGALFQVGTEDTPFTNQFQLSLLGATPVAPIPGPGTKFLVAMSEGTIHVHGAPKVSWTRLSLSASPGDPKINVKTPVNWEPGDEFVVAGSTFHESQTDDPSPPYDHHHIDYAEKLTVLSVSPDGLTITLDLSANTLVHPHYGGFPVTHTSPPIANQPNGQQWTFDQSAEVGLLTHNIKIQGDTSSSTSKFGGHMMIMRPSGSSATGGKGFVSNVEFFRMGQMQRLGRYPMHWHMMLDEADGQYIRNSSVHESYNRGITIHGTDNVDVAGNVVYNTVGHAVFLEDGSEQFNTIRDNLVLSTIKPNPGDEMLPSDNQLETFQNRTPASFWITNPMNEITGNVAAGTEGAGFWFIFPDFPTGLSGSDPFAASYFLGRRPIQTDLGLFDNNTAHSCGIGFDVNDSIKFTAGAPLPNNNHEIHLSIPWDPTNGPAILTGLTVHTCDTGIYAGIGNDKVIFERLITADCKEHIRLAAYHTVRNSLLIGTTGNAGTIPGFQIGYQIYDGAGSLIDSHMLNFDLGLRFAILSGGAGLLHPNHRFSGVTHGPNSIPRIVFADFTMRPDPTAPPGSPFVPIDPMNPNCANTGPGNPEAPSSWGQAIRDVDGMSLYGAIPIHPDPQYASVPNPTSSTIISNHPLMHMPGTWAEIALPSGAVGVYEKWSRLRFGHLRLYQHDFSQALQPVVDLTRELNVTPTHGTFPASQTYRNCFTRFFHKQWPIIVEKDFVYTLSWPNLPASTTTPMDVVLDDVELGDTATIVLKDIGAEPNAAISNAVQVFVIGDLDTATVTSYFVGANDLTIKFVNVNKIQTLGVSWQ